MEGIKEAFVQLDLEEKAVAARLTKAISEEIGSFYQRTGIHISDIHVEFSDITAFGEPLPAYALESVTVVSARSK